MAITKKPKVKEAQKEDEIAALINKGGSVATAPPDAKSPFGKTGCGAEQGDH